MPQQLSDTSPGSSLADFLLQLLLIGGTVLLAAGLALTVTSWLVIRRIRRSGSLLRGVETGVLTARSIAGDGGIRQLARLRLKLRRSGQATQRSLEAAAALGVPVGELPVVAADLGRAERSLENQLRLAEREPDRRVRLELARGIRGQVDAVTGHSAQLRKSLLELGNDVGAAQISRAGARLSFEVDVLNAWRSSYGSRQRN